MVNLWDRRVKTSKIKTLSYLFILTITILSLLSRYPDIPMAPGIKVNWGGSLPWRIGSEASSPAVITVWWSKIIPLWFDFIIADKYTEWRLKNSQKYNVLVLMTLKSYFWWLFNRHPVWSYSLLSLEVFKVDGGDGTLEKTCPKD